MHNGRNGHSRNGSNGNGSGKAPLFGAIPPAAPFFAMNREETQALYDSLSHATLADATSRAVVRRMGLALEERHG